ncbi:MAG TPA: element excision factor XisH family protein [Blastocatellia bacterium]|nr:element excision factor XisH family protein [Blastocatellia bacterium]
MSAKDIYHNHVRQALIKDGWTITADPLSLPWGATTVQVDLGAERLIAAEKDARKIAVEIKSFLSRSRVEDLEDALGQIVLYRYLLGRTQPERALYLAVRQDVYLSYLGQPHVLELLKVENVQLLVFNQHTEEVEQWISWNNTET